jgi:predicted acetyltransferase
MKAESPPPLGWGQVRLRFDRFVSYPPGGQLSSYYHFKIINGSNQEAGHINLRIQDTRHVRIAAGHIGYGIHPEMRGNAYSLQACRALAPFALKFHKRIILTADPDNLASIRIIEKLGAELIEEVMVPKNDPAYKGGARRKLRYAWLPG